MDTDTGRVEVLKLVVVNDCGTVMYASGAEAQQIGGQCIGVGETLTEEIIYDHATRRAAELQLDRLPHPDPGRHAAHRPRCCWRCGAARASTAPAESAKAC